MAAAIIDVYRALDQWAPFDTQMDFDNAGFLVGRGEREVRRVLVSLDITEAVAAEAGRGGAELSRALFRNVGADGLNIYPCRLRELRRPLFAVPRRSAVGRQSLSLLPHSV